MGHKKNFSGLKGDCVLEALYAVSPPSVKTSDVYEAAVATGAYDPRRGGMWIHDERFSDVLKILGITWRSVRVPSALGCCAVYRPGSVKPYKWTLYRFIKKHPKGRFLVHGSDHTVAVIDGDLIDPNFQESGVKSRVMMRIRKAEEIIGCL